MKKILVIQGHPRSESLCGSIAREYAAAAEQGGAQVDLLDLPRLKFDPILREGYTAEQALEPDLVKAQQLIRAAGHLVFVFPSWWASMPALLKGFIDRVFLPGFAFQYRENSPFPQKLLKGKTARIFISMDVPAWYYRWYYRAPGLRLLHIVGAIIFLGNMAVSALWFSLAVASKGNDLLAPCRCTQEWFYEEFSRPCGRHHRRGFGQLLKLA